MCPQDFKHEKGEEVKTWSVYIDRLLMEWTLNKHEYHEVIYTTRERERERDRKC